MSRSKRVRGKALLVIERLDGKYVPYDVTAFVQSCSENHREFDLDFDLCDSVLPVPVAARKLKVGERVRVSVVYEFEYTTDYWGEGDVNLCYHKERVLRKHRAPNHYVAKSRTLALV